MTIFAPLPLGVHQAETPEGFLLIRAVPIARLGVMFYEPSEIGLSSDTEGQIAVERHPEEVFAPDTLASFEGKPVTLDHPPALVTPENWRDLAVGTVRNVRRGSGTSEDDSPDLLLADLLLTDARAIQRVREGLREVSCGYEADYRPLGPGRAEQVNIIGNHVALVGRGRCGPRCAIADASRSSTNKAFTNKETSSMAFLFGGRLRTTPPILPKTTHDSSPPDPLAALSARLDRLEAKLEQALTPPPPDAASPEVAPSCSCGNAPEEQRDTLARAEILAPGSAFDPDASPNETCTCATKRRALAAALTSDSGRLVVAPLLKGRAETVSSLQGLTLDTVFVAAAEAMRHLNNARSAQRAAQRNVGPMTPGTPATPAVLNQRNNAFWAARNPSRL